MNNALAIIIGSLLLTVSNHASNPDPFAYKFEMTPEEGPLDAAVEKRYTAAFDKCQKVAVSTRANAACFDDEFARQDKTLNRIWGVTLARISPSMRVRLRAAQRQWAAKRDPFCKTKAEQFQGGTIQPVFYVNCRVEQTIRRTMWLSELR